MEIITILASKWVSLYSFNPFETGDFYHGGTFLRDGSKLLENLEVFPQYYMDEKVNTIIFKTLIEQNRKTSEKNSF